MMKLVRLLGLAAAAVLAVGATVASSASAAPPEYGRCVKVAKVEKKYNGSYTDKGCTKAATTKEKEEGKKNKYNWLPGGVKLGQTSTGGKAVLQEVGKYAVGCDAESSTGEYFGTKEARKLFVTFTGCHVPPYICTSPGHAEGELVTKELEGRAVWKNEAKHEAALDLYPAHGEELFIKFSCGELTVKVRGSILVPITANKMASTFTLKYKQKKGFQEVKDYEEGGKLYEDILEANFEEKGWAKSGQTITATVHNEEELELNTYV
ncbi:MAG TPA: hypothetical protein VMB51_08165 [Solirubrobacteraceae bacterium]|nr:hypothetical protein [Solirubrobacteraceae bacterium]